MAKDVELAGPRERVDGRFAPFDFVSRVMRDENAGSQADGNRCDREYPFPTIGQLQMHEAIESGAKKQEKTEGMSEQHKGCENGRENQSNFSRMPEQRQAKAGYSEREVVVHEAHVENVAVGEHGKQRSEKPGWAAGRSPGEGEQAPEKDEDAEGCGDLFRQGESQEFGCIKKNQIEEDVVVLSNEIKAGSLALFDQLSEPSVIDVAAQIAGFDVAMPEARDQQKDGNSQNERDSLCVWGSKILILHRRHFRIF